MGKLKVGIIGAGGIAQFAHIPCFQKIPDVEVIAISDINEEKLKFVSEKFKIPKTFKNWESLLEEDIDIISICSPNVFHAKQSIASLESGKHVLCEKPICISSKEAEEIFKTVEKTGKKFMGAFPRRFSGEAKVLKTLIEKGDFGQIYYVKTNYLRRRGIPGLGTWFTNKNLSGGGAMMDIGVHMLDFVIYLIGAPMPEIIVGTTFNKFKEKAIDGGWPPLETRIGDKKTNIFDVEELSSGYIKFSNGVALFVEASWAGNSEEGSRTSIFGTKAGAQLPDPEDPLKPIKIYSEINGILTNITPFVPKSDVYQEEFNHFIECIRKDKEPITKKEEIISVVKIIEGIYKSAETQKPVILKN